MDLSDQLEQITRQPTLLIACDYDGTLAPIVSNPSDARADRESLVALRALAHLPSTHVAVISGRSLSDLSEMMGETDGIHLVGSHGSEFDVGFAQEISKEAKELRDRVLEELERVAETGDGFGIETKPASIAFHYRNANEVKAQEAVRTIESGCAAWDGVHVKRGKMVIELGVVNTNKGKALETLRKRLGASACLFMGDDVTDEDAFAMLTGPDVGIKVGPGASAASYRVGDTHDIAKLLARVTQLRQEWAAGADATPIEEHAMLSDQRTVALMTSAARITWLCAPRADSPAIFAELVGGPSAGFFSIGPSDSALEAGQRYMREANTLETKWGGLTVTDYMDCSGARPTQRAGRTDLVRVISGTGKVRIEFAPRLDFGRVATQIAIRDDGLVVEGLPDPVVLRAPGVTWEIVKHGVHETAVGEIEVFGKPAVLELRFGTGDLSEAKLSESERRSQTTKFWSKWLAGLSVPEVMPDLVRRSALALRGLVHGPTGGVLAAATTSLPEDPGGVRNWDYRYCWLRDGAITCEALVRLGSNAEAIRFLDWLLGVLDKTAAPERLAPVYTITGHELGPEAELAELPGYMGSRPVRVGNGASTQLQLDVFGPVVELIWRLVESGAPVTFEHWQLVEQMVQAVERRWMEPDHGIWEVRVERRHWVHSKIMCWVTIDRAIKIGQSYLGKTRNDWQELADTIRDDVLAHGYNQEARAFTAWYGSDELDASVLLVGTMGLIDPEDERFVSTVDRIEAELLEGPTVYRYKYNDGLPGHEGGFNFCTNWLIDSYIAVGRERDAWALFNEFATLAGPTGLIPEEYDTKSGRGLGNHPQAYSHAGFIMNALNLAACS
ncbi:MAG: trehalose-phosphatase [Phycisphaera sp.]|nr:MAG: trehalose-phosphatase [Phycisphaera sp.]